MTAIEAANKAATDTFDAYLTANHAAAATHVPDLVIEAAQKAYVRAGGRYAIDVLGRGNRTHPVCGVEVRINRTKTSGDIR